MKSTFSVILLALAAMLIASGCSPATGAGPEAAAKDAFEQWAQTRGTPYNDVTYSTLTDDGTYATVRITAKFRPTAQADWVEMEADVECRNVGGKWQASPFMNFELTQKQVDKQKASATATATAAKQAAQQVSNLISIDSVVGISAAKFDVVITNRDNVPHEVKIEVVFDPPSPYSGGEPEVHRIMVDANSTKTYHRRTAWAGEKENLNPVKWRIITVDGYEVTQP